MTYWIDLFTPETWDLFRKSDRTITGFRPKQRGLAERVRPGDMMVCYVTRLSRWCGILEVVDGPFEDSTPIFALENDPFPIRFHVKPLAALDLETAIPIHDAGLWTKLSFTRDLKPGSGGWTGMVRSSLRAIEDEDGETLTRAMKGQTTSPTRFPLDEDDRRKLERPTVRRTDRSVSVVVPESEESDSSGSAPHGEIRESLKVQALLADVGHRLGLSIWIPRNDRGRVLREWPGDEKPVLDRLPLNYDDTTLRTIEQIDLLWLRGRSIVRAFEVEHTTSIYSGILRMADLLALQPNMDIRLNIVAPDSRREKVFKELQRPVFTLLERGPLSEVCNYLSYESVESLAATPNLGHVKESIVEEYEESAGEE